MPRQVQRTSPKIKYLRKLMSSPDYDVINICRKMVKVLHLYSALTLTMVTGGSLGFWFCKKTLPHAHRGLNH